MKIHHLIHTAFLALLLGCSFAQAPAIPSQIGEHANPASASPEVPLTATPTPAILVPPENPPPGEEEPEYEYVHLGMPWADFSLRFDPVQWKRSPLDAEIPDLEMLTYRRIAGCRITPNIPVDLGDGWTIENEQGTFGERTLSVKRFFEGDILRFIAYSGFLGPEEEGGVEVHFGSAAEACIQIAEDLFSDTVVSTLQDLELGCAFCSRSTQLRREQ